MEKAETRLRTVESEHQNLLSAHAALEREQEDLLVCLADQDLLVQELKERLKGFGQAFEEDDDEEEENVM